jgi:lambda family phage minor tail protein L
MTTGAPASHVEEAQKLTADALVDLFEITPVGTSSPTVVRFRDGPQVTWQANVYESMAVRLMGYQVSADGGKSRPTLTIANPAGLFNSFVFAGYLDGAQVVRRRVLRQHLETNVNLSDPNFWYVARIKEVVAGQGITMELRSLSDGPDLVIPARKFMSPEFPFVTL